MVEVQRDILTSDQQQADANRETFNSNRVLVINLMSSPGAGKTTLLEKSIGRLGLTVGVIEGDLATENDARRIRACGVQAEQITTGTACHLDAHMIAAVLPRFDLQKLDVLFIENVGNLICPACFDLGQHENVTLLSVPEGDDKPEKYPVMFRDSSLMLLTKTDYLAISPNFKTEGATASLRRVGSDAPIIEVCAQNGAGLDQWVHWLEQRHTQLSSTKSNSLGNKLIPITGVEWLARITDLVPDRPFRLLNVCGGHERSISEAGLRAALPKSIELIPGPGCPVCVCPEEDLYDAIQLASSGSATVVAFGDMLGVPVNAPRSEFRTLEQARAGGADVRPVASPLQAVAIARAEPGQPVVFFAAGFETTMAPVAAKLAEGVPDNFSVLLAGRRTWPAVAHLLATGEAKFDALIAPGHVATIMGAEEWRFVVDSHSIPTAIAGFHPESLLAATHAVLAQYKQGHVALENHYPELVEPEGNSMARTTLSQVFDVIDANWRGIGVIPESGYTFNPDFARFDARNVFALTRDETRKRLGEMPAGCDCARVVLGQIYPNQCRLFGAGCNPESPVGPCMVSDEGACRIWWSNGIRTGQSHRSSRVNNRP